MAKGKNCIANEILYFPFFSKTTDAIIPITQKRIVQINITLDANPIICETEKFSFGVYVYSINPKKDTIHEKAAYITDSINTQMIIIVFVFFIFTPSFCGDYLLL